MRGGVLVFCLGVLLFRGLVMTAPVKVLNEINMYIFRCRLKTNGGSELGAWVTSTIPLFLLEMIVVYK